MIGDESELRMPRRGRERVVRSLGSCFIALAAAAIVLGIVSLIGAFREAAKLGAVPNETIRTLGILGTRASAARRVLPPRVPIRR